MCLRASTEYGVGRGTKFLQLVGCDMIVPSSQ